MGRCANSSFQRLMMIWRSARCRWSSSIGSAWRAAAFDDAAAGKTHEARVHVGEQLHEVGAQAAGAMLPGVVRESDTMSTSVAPLPVKRSVAIAFFGFRRLEVGRVFLPLR